MAKKWKTRRGKRTSNSTGCQVSTIDLCAPRVWGAVAACGAAFATTGSPADPAGRRGRGVPRRLAAGGVPHHGHGPERPPGDRSSARRVLVAGERRRAADQDREARGRAGGAGPGDRQQRQHDAPAGAGGSRVAGAGAGVQPGRRSVRGELQRRSLPGHAARGGLHARSERAAAGLEAHRFARGNGHARRHPDVGRAPEGERTWTRRRSWW